MQHARQDRNNQQRSIRSIIIIIRSKKESFTYLRISSQNQSPAQHHAPHHNQAHSNTQPAHIRTTSDSESRPSTRTRTRRPTSISTTTTTTPTLPTRTRTSSPGLRNPSISRNSVRPSRFANGASHRASSETLASTDRRRNTVAVRSHRALRSTVTPDSLLHAAKPSLHRHDIRGLRRVELGLREGDLAVVEVVDDVHASQDGVAEGKEALP